MKANIKIHVFKTNNAVANYVYMLSMQSSEEIKTESVKTDLQSLGFMNLVDLEYLGEELDVNVKAHIIEPAIIGYTDSWFKTNRFIQRV